MRVIGITVLFCVGFIVADQPGRSLTPEETTALRQQITVGRHLLAALSLYSRASAELNVPIGDSLSTHAPTIEVLHAAGYISDFDFSVAQRYRAMPHPVPADQDVATRVTMQTDRGELIFDTRGSITLRQSQ
jgi:hypothetical protein